MGQVSLGLNLVAVPLELGCQTITPAYQSFPTPPSVNKRKESEVKKSTQNSAVLSLSLIEGVDLTEIKEGSSIYDIYCKFRYSCEYYDM